MTPAIIVHIALDEADPTRCGLCEHQDLQCDTRYAACKIFLDTIRESYQYAGGCVRCANCLRAEKLLADLREATRRLLDSGVIADNDPGDGTAIPNADAALAAIDTAKEEP